VLESGEGHADVVTLQGREDQLGTVRAAKRICQDLTQLALPNRTRRGINSATHSVERMDMYAIPRSEW